MKLISIKLAVLVCICCKYIEVRGDTIRDLILVRDDLSVLRSYMTNLQIMSALGSAGQLKYTFFAPSNFAFANVPQDIIYRYKSPSDAKQKQLNEIMSYHCVSSVKDSYLFDTLTSDVVLSTDASGSPKLFVRKTDDGTYIDGAKIVTKDLIVSNGIVHIIDHWLYEVGRSVVALQFIVASSQQPSTESVQLSLFYNLLTNYNERVVRQNTGEVTTLRDMNQRSKITTFVVSDSYMQKIPIQRLEDLKSDVVQLRQVMQGHVILDEVWYTDQLIQAGKVAASFGTISVSSYGNNVYVRNTCAGGKVIKGNITVVNGVVHILDSLLVFTYNDFMGRLNEDFELSRFTVLAKSCPIDMQNQYFIVKPGTTSIPDNQKYTIFASVDSGTIGVDMSTITQNQNRLKQVMLMQIVAGVIPVSQLLNNSVMQTLLPGKTIKFYVTPNAVLVEVDYVRSRIIEADICVRNGMMHKVSNILGIPTLSVWDSISQSDNLMSLNNLCMDVGLNSFLDSPANEITMFAPVDAAFIKMRGTSYGQRLFNQQYRSALRNVLNRHILLGLNFLDGHGTQVVTSRFDSWTLTADGGGGYRIYFGTEVIHVIQANIRMTNGVMHLIDGVLFTNSPTADELTASAKQSNAVSMLLFVLCVIAVFATVKS